jgi:hypothetical protein
MEWPSSMTSAWTWWRNFSRTLPLDPAAGAPRLLQRTAGGRAGAGQVGRVVR